MFSNAMHRPNPTRPRSQNLRRNQRQLRMLTVVLALSLVGRAAALGPVKTYATLTLRDGRQLSSVEVITYTTTDVLVRHAGGATSLRSDVLPEHVIADLHLPAPRAAQPIAYDAPFRAGADQPAADGGETAPAAPRPAGARAFDTTGQGAAAHLAAAKPSPPGAAPATSAGDDHIPLLAGGPRRSAAAPTSAWITLAGRVAVTLPASGPHLLGDVEVRAYPAALLARYLPQARAQGAAVARQYRELAAVAVQEGRPADGATLTARAAQAADQTLDFMPLAPYTARSDAYGHFTLRHDLRDARLVAISRVTVPQGTWTFSWIDVAPGENPHLTEANATLVTAPGATGPRLAIQ